MILIFFNLCHMAKKNNTYNIILKPKHRDQHCDTVDYPACNSDISYQSTGASSTCSARIQFLDSVPGKAVGGLDHILRVPGYNTRLRVLDIAATGGLGQGMEKNSLSLINKE